VRADDIQLIPALSALLRRLPLIVRILAAAAVLGLGQAFLTPSRYKATASFIVAQSQTAPALGSLSGLAGRLGAFLPPSLSGDNTDRLMQAAITSREVLDAVLDTTLVVAGFGPGGQRDTLRLLSWYD